MVNNNNQLHVPETRDAMDQFKMEAAKHEVSVNLKKGYNGSPDLPRGRFHRRLDGEEDLGRTNFVEK